MEELETNSEAAAAPEEQGSPGPDADAQNQDEETSLSGAEIDVEVVPDPNPEEIAPVEAGVAEIDVEVVPDAARSMSESAASEESSTIPPDLEAPSAADDEAGVVGEELDVEVVADPNPEETEPTQTAVPEIDVEMVPDAAASQESAEPIGQAILPPVEISDTELQAILEGVIYIADEPLTLAQIANGLAQAPERIEAILRRLMQECDKPGRGIAVREVAGGFKMATKPEHHDAVRSFVKSLKPPLKLSLPALETLAVIAYKQPVTAPEIMEVRGVQGAGVLKTLLDRKLIAGAGRKNVIGKPILYKTTKEFLIQFGLKDISELPSLKEFEEIRRMAFADSDTAASPVAEAPSLTAEATPAAEAAPSAEAVPGPEAVPAPEEKPAASPRDPEQPTEPEA
ncbi:MAG TPA: SMC-Scp complex subunit ScpB [Bryobacteraceae bacterium]|nr:SMC-Scp complex subunit ScpB [Bryobacteraceae bacterium]